MNGGTALHAAAIGGSREAVRRLLQAGAPADAVDYAGRSAIHYAARGGSGKCIRTLCRACADLERTNVLGWTPLHVASNFSHPGAINALLKIGARASPVDGSGCTPLHLAADRLGEDVDGCRCKECTKQHARKLRAMRLLLAHGALPSAGDCNGATPAHVSAAHDCSEGIRMLRRARANLWGADVNGFTPLRISRAGRQASRAARTLLFMDGSLPRNVAAAASRPRD
uniref:Uncharacterized protein n=1 Tax=Haptolina ericina TaxID=156174 RepID=A0A7S3AXC2_9EUKA